jgi:RNA polymerase sigma-70 factor (ECF subfamily)
VPPRRRENRPTGGGRPWLTRLAYRYLGSVGDAEDAVQDAWLRFSQAGAVDDPPRFLSRVVTRLCLDRLKSAERRRETYVGPWLPEPVVERAGSIEPDMGDAALDISYAVMRALERLSPLERAALFLHDLYEVPFEEIAETIGRTPAACRKLASRARKAIAEACPRYRPSEAEIDGFVAAFAEATRTGDARALGRLLADDVEFISDGGGKAAAALNVLTGNDRVARLLTGIALKNPHPDETHLAVMTINGAPALAVYLAGKLEQTMSFDLDAERRIAAIYVMRNPDKLVRVPPAGG